MINDTEENASSSDKLPQNWAMVVIGELVGSKGVFCDGDWVESKDQDQNGNVRLIQLADIGDGDFKNKSSRFLTDQKAQELNCTFLKADDALVARMPDPLGRACLFPLMGEKKFVTVVDVCVIRFGHDYINSKYFMYMLNSPASRKKISDHQTGSTRKRISRGNLSSITFPIPPLNEQHRIVAKIEALFSELDKGIESFKTAREQLKIYRQALLKHAFSGKLTEQWRAENPDKLESAEALLQRIQTERQQRYQQQLNDWEANGKQGRKPKAPKNLPPLTAEELAELPELPEGWAWCKWENILDYDDGAFKRGPFGSALKKEFFVKNGYKVYEQYCPINDDCSFERYYVSDEKFKELESFAVRANDFLVSCSGVTLGRITQVPKDFKEGIINQALLRVRINSNVYDFTFFKTLFRSRFFQKRIFENSTGSAIPNVKGVNELKAIPVPICSLLEQQQIILELESRFSTLDQLDQTITTALQQAEALRQSILKKAFSGQLVPQDPSDEPASVLLARIQAEKAAQALQTKPKKTQKRKATA